jgi:hypothetical protein
MTATVNYTVSSKKNVIIVPNSALGTQNNTYYVTLENGLQQPVQIGKSDDTYTEIVS